MFIFKLIAVGVPIAMIIFGCVMIGLSSKDEASDVRGPGEALGLLSAVAGVVVAVVEFLLVSVWKFLFP